MTYRNSEIDVLRSGGVIGVRVRPRVTPGEAVILGRQAGIVPGENWQSHPAHDISMAYYNQGDFRTTQDSIEYISSTALLVATVLKSLREGSITMGIKPLENPNDPHEGLPISSNRIWIRDHFRDTTI